MQENNIQKINSFKNYYCDAIYCSLGDFLEKSKIDKVIEDNALNDEQIKLLCEYAVLKNKRAGVTYLNLKVPDFGFGRELLDKYNMKGNEIISALKMNSIPSKALIGQRLILEVESLIDYNDGFLSDLSDLSARAEIPILFRLGQDLEEVGKIVNKFSASPVQTLESYGFLDRECYVLGLNFIDKEDQRLLNDYDVTCILSPCSDGEEGRGAINLYNFIYNDLRIGFASRICSNVDMLKECWLAKVNTSNLMYENGLIKTEDLLSALCDEDGIDIEMPLCEKERRENIFEKKIDLKVDDFENLFEKVREIASQMTE